MHTYLLSDEDVHRYLLDLRDRLKALGSDFPKTWVTLGLSGDKIAKSLIECLDLADRDELRVLRASYSRQQRTIVLRDELPWPILDDHSIFLIDAAVHSGASMSMAVDEICDHGATNIITYSLVVKRTSAFIPNFFGILIGEYDRALFQLEKIPNNRLQTKRPFGTLRAIRDSDINRTPSTLNCGVTSLDKISMGDLMYSVKTQHSTAMIYEVGKILAGFLHFSIDQRNIMHIDAVANDAGFRGQGIGGTLMRWAESYARSSNCHAIELWAIQDRVDFYKKFGFQTVSDKGWNLGPDETYFAMRRKILYNVRLAELAGH